MIDDELINFLPKLVNKDLQITQITVDQYQIRFTTADLVSFCSLQSLSLTTTDNQHINFISNDFEKRSDDQFKILLVLGKKIIDIYFEDNNLNSSDLCLNIENVGLLVIHNLSDKESIEMYIPDIGQLIF